MMTLEEARKFATRRFTLNPTASDAEILGFEQQYGIQLPQEYRDFLIYIGNGGTQFVRQFFPLGNDEAYEILLKLVSRPFRYSSIWIILRRLITMKTITFRVLYPFLMEAVVYVIC